MAALPELESLRRMIEDSVKNTDKRSLLRNLQIFIENYKNHIEPDELDNLQQLLTELKQVTKHKATYHEFILFLVVMTFIVSIFGEIQIMTRNNAEIKEK